jgi:hypothetical protein
LNISASNAWLNDWGSGLGAILELDTDTLAIDRAFMPVPGESFDTDLGDIAAETAVAVDQGRARAGAGRGQRGRKSSRAAADDENVRFQDDIDRSGGFSDLLHASGGSVQRGTRIL